MKAKGYIMSKIFDVFTSSQKFFQSKDVLFSDCLESFLAISNLG